MKTKNKKCETPRCRGKTKGKLCANCRQRAYRNKNPVRASYLNLKSNAKRRGKVFELTFEQFQKFAIESDYMAGKGRTSTSYHIDRIDPEKGYTVDNIRVLTNSENVKRHAIYLKYNFGPTGKPDDFRVVPAPIIKTEPGDDCPF